MSSKIVNGEDGIKHNFLILEEENFQEKKAWTKLFPNNVQQQFNLLHARSIYFFLFLCFY